MKAVNRQVNQWFEVCPNSLAGGWDQKDRSGDYAGAKLFGGGTAFLELEN